MIINSAADPTSTTAASGIRPLPALAAARRYARLVRTVFLFGKRERQIVFETGPHMASPTRSHEQMGVGPHAAQKRALKRGGSNDSHGI
jgi:hypothetical protein